MKRNTCRRNFFHKKKSFLLINKMSNSRESYDYPPYTNGSFYGKAVPPNEIQNTLTPCSDCYSIHQANKNRTDYDRFWLKFYNNKAQNYDTDLMKLQFSR